MTAVTNDERFRQPAIKRLGLDDGWWFFCPHFLNLGLPLVFVDACLLPEAEQLDLENFGSRKPHTPLPEIDFGVGLLGGRVGLYNTATPPKLVTAHWFRKLTLPRALQATRVGLIVGDSYALELTWSALWTCRVGTMTIADSSP